jgi:hypothetical protein
VDARIVERPECPRPAAGEDAAWDIVAPWPHDPPLELDWKIIELVEDPAQLSSTPAAGSPDARPAFGQLYGDEQRK